MTSTYLNSSAFNLKRYKDNHGKWYAINVNRRPRGKAWLKLMQQEHTAQGARLSRLVGECKQLLKTVSG